MGQREASRPAYNLKHSGNATNTDLLKQSRASVQRRWPDGRDPRPASLGEASRPHFVVSHARLCVEDKHTDLTYLQLTLRGIAASYRPWKGYK